MTTPITITHTHQEGTLLDTVDLRRDPSLKAAVKAAGFRWSNNIGWYLRNSRDNDLTDTQTAQIRAVLEAHDVTLDFEIDNSRRSFSERVDAKTSRASNRATGLDTKASRLEAETRHLTDNAMSQVRQIPLGQPILAGHHSAPAHTRHLANMRRTLDQAAETGSAARQTAQRARAATHTGKQGEDGTFLVNRLLEAERNKDETTAAEILEYIARQGITFIDPATLEAGQRWRVRRSWVEIVKINRKTATVRAIDQHGRRLFPDSITNRVDLRYFHKMRSRPTPMHPAQSTM